MINTGIDIIEISRFSDMKNFDAFLKYAYTKKEREYITRKKNPYRTAAAMFAAKEAFSKYLGSGFRGFGLKDVEILHDGIGKPHIIFMNGAARADVSISHSKNYAVAVVCGEGVPNGKYEDLIKSYRAMLPKRTPHMHKGDCGRVMIIGGSQRMVGAACLASTAALHSGSGLVTAAVPKSIQPVAAAKLTEVMTLPLDCEEHPEDLNITFSAKAAKQILPYLNRCDAVAIGPGMGRGGGVAERLKTVLKTEIPCVIDADGLNTLSENTGILADVPKSRGNIIITPHPIEMERLCGEKVPSDDKGRMKLAAEFAAKYNVVVLLKGHNTVVAAPNGEVHINESGNSGMATGGMGDVLTGIITSFCGQGMSAYNAAVLGAFVHGLGGDMAAEDKGKFGMSACDVVEKLPYAIKFLSE